MIVVRTRQLLGLPLATENEALPSSFICCAGSQGRDRRIAGQGVTEAMVATAGLAHLQGHHSCTWEEILVCRGA